MADDNTRQKLYELTRRSRERELEFMGVKVDALRALEKKINEPFQELAEQVKKNLSHQGGDIVERHNASKKRAARLIQKQIEGIIRPDVADFLPPHLFGYCLAFIHASEVGTGSDDAIITAPSGGTGAASVTFDATGGRR